MAQSEPLTDSGRAWLERRIQQLRSRQKSVGPFRAAGIQRTIAGMKSQIRSGTWTPHGSNAVQPTADA